jgi:deoxyribose-phosphate aldolase
MTSKDLPAHIESTLFAPHAKLVDIEALCDDAREKSYRAVCVNGSRVALARTLLEDSPVQVVALVGFPIGAGAPDTKRYETEIAVDDGAHEIDFVINLGSLRDGDHKMVLREMRDIAEAADERPVKVVFDTRLTNREEKILVCQLALDSGVQFVCAGLDIYSLGTTVEDIALLRETLGKDFGLKACANIRTAAEALPLLQAGATRLSALPGADLSSGLVN